jgi:hypothetical protein
MGRSDFDFVPAIVLFVLFGTVIMGAIGYTIMTGIVTALRSI